MKGLVIISGINYAGKTTVMGLFKKLWEEFGLPQADFFTGSYLMRELGGRLSYHQLAQMDPTERDRLREEMFSLIREQASKGPVFLDCHLVFSDGERVDFSPLLGVLKGIVFVRADPETVIARRLSDPQLDSHPGRQDLADLNFISELQEQEKFESERLAQRYLDEEGKSLPLVVVDNSGEDVSKLESTVRGLFNEIYSQLEGSVSPFVEGHNYQRRK